MLSFCSAFIFPSKVNVTWVSLSPFSFSFNQGEQMIGGSLYVTIRLCPSLLRGGGDKSGFWAALSLKKSLRTSTSIRGSSGVSSAHSCSFSGG